MPFCDIPTVFSFQLCVTFLLHILVDNKHICWKAKLSMLSSFFTHNSWESDMYDSFIFYFADQNYI
ncbi:putative peptidase C70, AvrRpt2 [Rosa chinensis]|uniref:Putative peptidase C70, AvrRpt2 n=1 Tax=Rosa chinensis TaxID=74649 RepID=A0A2P6SF77_ROSCH|nr:putative peptidase C70, AvrRpt2 [Rosa chinensis]